VVEDSGAGICGDADRVTHAPTAASEGTDLQVCSSRVRKATRLGEEPTTAAVAKATRLSREHLGRRYRYLFM
jgi:hypothetical protein